MALLRPLQPGDRVVYDPPRAFLVRGGRQGTVLDVYPAGPEQAETTVRVDWDSEYPERHPQPSEVVFVRNVRGILAKVAPVAIDTPTTAYEVDSHHDDIAHPDHYTAGRKYEPKDVIRDWGLGFNLGAVVKYVARAGRKADTPTLKDLRKARQFLDFEIEALEAEDAK